MAGDGGFDNTAFVDVVPVRNFGRLAGQAAREESVLGINPANDDFDRLAGRGLFVGELFERDGAFIGTTQADEHVVLVDLDHLSVNASTFAKRFAAIRQASVSAEDCVQVGFRQSGFEFRLQVFAQLIANVGDRGFFMLRNVGLIAFFARFLASQTRQRGIFAARFAFALFATAFWFVFDLAAFELLRRNRCGRNRFRDSLPASRQRTTADSWQRSLVFLRPGRLGAARFGLLRGGRRRRFSRSRFLRGLSGLRRGFRGGGVRSWDFGRCVGGWFAAAHGQSGGI